MKVTLIGVLLVISASVYASDDDEGASKKQAITTTTTTPKPPPKSVTCPKQGKDYYVQIRIMGQGDWKYEMSMVESQAFQDVREKIYDCILQTYDDYDFYQDTIVLAIENATEGFTVNMAVRFTKEGDGHMNRMTQKVQAGKLCDMETSPKFISCAELDQQMLYPMANCPAPCADMGCWPSCDSSCCQQTPEQTVYLPVAAPPPPPPPPAAPAVVTMCADSCPETCAPSCSPQCCFVQKRWLAKQKLVKPPAGK